MESFGSEVVSLSRILQGSSPWNFCGKFFSFFRKWKQNILETAVVVTIDLEKFRIFFTWSGKMMLKEESNNIKYFKYIISNKITFTKNI